MFVDLFVSFFVWLIGLPVVCLFVSSIGHSIASLLLWLICRLLIWLLGYSATLLNYLTTAYQLQRGHVLAQLVEALRYKPEDRGFDSPVCHW